MLASSAPIRHWLLSGALLLAAAAPAPAAEPGEVPGSPQGETEAALPGGVDPLFDEDWAEESEAEAGVYDPFEEGNRAVLRFNQQVERFLWDPLTRGYRFVLPEVGRRSIRRVFGNLQTPVYLVNHVLQLRPVAAAETLGAFVMNTTWGMGGLFDAASAVHLERKPADFGQTLAFVGLPAGPYLIVPMFGPTTVRDGFGGVVDFFLHPLTYFLGIPTLAVWGGSEGFARREAAVDRLEALEEGAIDYYSVLRSAYVQHRRKVVERYRRQPEATLNALLPGEESGAALLAVPGDG